VPNSTLAVVGAFVLPFVFVTGIVAAVAIPVYQDYAKRAQQTDQPR
jgi:Tfp pilus assembly major pilin PilA